MENKMIGETRASNSSKSSSSVISNHIVVGIDDQLQNIKDRLTGYPSKLEVISIVGMGGIGKTTLARTLYADPLLADYFDIRGWTCLSQEYQLIDILLGLILQICQSDSIGINDLESSSREVGAQLWRGLKGRRYLVVIDDIWDVEAWQNLRMFFPNDCNGSRILLTSRDVNVGKYASPNYPPHELSLMDPETSWELLSQKLFFNYLQSTGRDVGAQLWRGLKSVMIDDIGDVKAWGAWEKFRNFSLNDCTGSRIILTNRGVKVSKYANLNYKPPELGLVDADTCWELLYKMTLFNDLGSTSREVGVQLWKGLEGRRYLLVIDDICNAEAWENFITFFPNDCNITQLLLSNRDLNVGKYTNPDYPPHEFSLMGMETSWELLSRKIFDDSENTNGLVGAQLWKGLKGKRHLVVIDEIWEFKAWEIFRTFFPNDCNGSKILFTSGDVDVGKYANLNDQPHESSQMDPDPSWELLSKDLFLSYFCSKSLVRIGKSLAVKCQGLPLTINLVAEHLSNVGRTPLDWLNVENSLESLEKHESDILALSYNYLPHRLKLCFLFTAYEYAQFCKRLHPEASLQKITTSSIPNTEMKIREVIREIMTMQKVRSEMAMQKSTRPEINQHFGMPTQRLVRLWIAAGFITAESPRTLEDVAEDCLEELTSRNLVMVTKRGSSGRPKRCIVHDLTIEMCRRLDVEISGMTGDHLDELYPFALFGDIDTTTNLVQSIEEFSNTKRKHLRYLEISTSSTIPPSVFKFCNLQTFINHHLFPDQNLPREIWLMSQLRHLHAGDSCHLPNPRRPHTQEDSISILTNLQSVSLSSASCTREVVEGMPNLRRLKLNEVRTECSAEEQSLNCLNNIFSLKQLQSLRLSLQNLPRCLQHWRNPPPNLRKVTLARSCLSGKVISMLASLSNLEILKLVHIDLSDGVLEYGDKIFHKLRVLLLYCPNLRIWKAETINLPSLQHLLFKNCNYLSEIPLEISDICTLEVIGCTIVVLRLKCQQEKFNKNKEIWEMMSLRFKSLVQTILHS